MKNLSARLLFLSLLLVVYVRAQAETICEVQAYQLATGFSPLQGQTVTVTGVVTVPPGIFVPRFTSIYLRGTGDDVCGVNVFSRAPIGNLELGDTITVKGTVEEYILFGGDGATTEIVVGEGGVIELIKADTLYVEPEAMSTGEVGREENEGKLVRVTGKVVAKEGSREFTVDDGSGPIVIYDQGRMFTSDPIWQNLFLRDQVTVIGVVAQSDPEPPYLSDYRIWPRSPAPPFEDVFIPPCIPDTLAGRATLEVTGRDGNRVNIFCPGCPGDVGKVIIKYSGPHGGRIRLRIFDAYGRCVATLDDFLTLCGESQIEWDGRNELMEMLPMGLYHITVTASDPRTGAQTEQTVPIVIGRRLK